MEGLETNSVILLTGINKDDALHCLYDKSIASPKHSCDKSLTVEGLVLPASATQFNIQELPRFLVFSQIIFIYFL